MYQIPEQCVPPMVDMPLAQLNPVLKRISASKQGHELLEHSVSRVSELCRTDDNMDQVETAITSMVNAEIGINKWLSITMKRLDDLEPSHIVNLLHVFLDKISNLEDLQELVDALAQRKAKRWNLSAQQLLALTVSVTKRDELSELVEPLAEASSIAADKIEEDHLVKLFLATALLAKKASKADFGNFFPHTRTVLKPHVKSLSIVNLIKLAVACSKVDAARFTIWEACRDLLKFTVHEIYSRVSEISAPQMVALVQFVLLPLGFENDDVDGIFDYMTENMKQELDGGERTNGISERRADLEKAGRLSVDQLSKVVILVAKKTETSAVNFVAAAAPLIEKKIRDASEDTLKSICDDLAEAPACADLVKAAEKAKSRSGRNGRDRSRSRDRRRSRSRDRGRGDRDRDRGRGDRDRRDRYRSRSRDRRRR